jgi:hypothetical protein
MLAASYRYKQGIYMNMRRPRFRLIKPAKFAELTVSSKRRTYYFGGLSGLANKPR